MAEELTKLQQETLAKLAKAPMAGRDIRHGTWQSLSKRKLIEGPDSSGYIRITQKGREAIKAN